MSVADYRGRDWSFNTSSAKSPWQQNGRLYRADENGQGSENGALSWSDTQKGKHGFLLPNATTAFIKIKERKSVNEMRSTVLFHNFACHWTLTSSAGLSCCVNTPNTQQLHLCMLPLNRYIYRVNAAERRSSSTWVFFCGPVLNPRRPAPTVWKSWDKMSKILHCTLF